MLSWLPWWQVKIIHYCNICKELETSRELQGHETVGCQFKKKKKKNIHLPQRQILPLSGWIIGFSLPSGNIRNTERLSYEKQQSYRITVTAFDCGQKSAQEDVTVHIDVKPICKPGWQGQSCRSGSRVLSFPFSNIAIHTRIKCPSETEKKSFVMTENQQFFFLNICWPPRGMVIFRIMLSEGDQEACIRSPEGNSAGVFFFNTLAACRSIQPVSPAASPVSADSISEVRITQEWRRGERSGGLEEDGL